MHLDERGKGENLEVGVSCMWKAISAEWLHRVERKVKRGDRRKKKRRSSVSVIIVTTSYAEIIL